MHITLKRRFSNNDSVVWLTPFRQEIESVGGVGSDGIVFVRAHSQGAAILDRAIRCLSPAEQKMIQVLTLGGQMQIGEQGLAGSRNVVAEMDFVSFLGSPVKYLFARICGIGNTEFIKTGARIPFSDHFFRHPGYMQVLQDDGRQFQKNYRSN